MKKTFHGTEEIFKYSQPYYEFQEILMRYSIAGHGNDIIKSRHLRRVLHVYQETKCHKLLGKKTVQYSLQLIWLLYNNILHQYEYRLPVYDRLKTYVIHLSFLKDITPKRLTDLLQKDKIVSALPVVYISQLTDRHIREKGKYVC